MNKLTIKNIKDQILASGVLEDRFNEVFQDLSKRFGNLVTEETLVTMLAKEFQISAVAEGGISYDLSVIDEENNRPFENNAFIECYFINSNKGYTKTNPRECRHIFVMDDRKVAHVLVSSAHLLEVVDKLEFSDKIRITGFSKFGRNLGLSFQSSDISKEENMSLAPIDVLFKEYSESVEGVQTNKSYQGKACYFEGLVASSFVSNSYLGCLICNKKIVQNTDKSKIGLSMNCPKCHKPTTVTKFSFNKLVIGDSSGQMQVSVDSNIKDLDRFLHQWVMAIGFWKTHEKYGPEFQVVYVAEKQKQVNEMVSPEIEVVEDDVTYLDNTLETDILAYVKNIGQMDMDTFSKKLKAFNCKKSAHDVIDYLIKKELVLLENDMLVINHA